jgi:hypothetical protein
LISEACRRGWGAFSLLLAYRIFRIDRTNAERAQVDLIGAWATPTYPGTGTEVGVQACIRNGSELPIKVKTLALEIHTSWLCRPAMLRTDP